MDFYFSLYIRKISYLCKWTKIGEKMEQTEHYRNRVSDRLLREQLEAAGVVLVQGAKWCGKTTTAVHAAGSVL